MADLTIVDPLGRHVTLHDHTWYGHIVKGHPEMASRRAEVESALRTPDSIHLSTSDADCRVYYRQTSGTLLVAVVADVTHGYAKTAYLARRTKGTQEWP